MTKTDELRLLTIKEVASYCQVDEKTIRRWIAAGDLHAFRLGRQLRISEHELRRFVHERWTG